MLERTPRLWDGLRGARLFITGGTGFFGTWLLESLLHADRELGLGARALVLTRDEALFRARSPRLAADPRLGFHRGDVRTFAFPPGGFTHVVHAGAEASLRLDPERSELARDVIVSGTRRALEFSARCGARKFLFASSGAVYGRRKPGAAPVAENDPSLSAPLDAPSAYGEGKRAAERLCERAAEGAVDATIARGFSFVGPHLPFDDQFAVGSFLRDALRGGPIEVRGDGTPVRSYLYASDLAAWLWTILLRGRPGRSYNVGSERGVSIAELARLVAQEAAPGARVSIAGRPTPGLAPEARLPDTSRARAELGLSETVGLEEALRRTAAWARARSV
ncbi:MAG: NAD-dependent epimerase/dehydratase family protein [Elusimicrobia bacterium]|nr:NAD-dependent epimerase/dehydratase family protein [Elusimicrobiota bacterium]